MSNLVDFRWSQQIPTETWLKFLAGEHEIEGQIAPPLPPATMQEVFVGSSGFASFQEGNIFVETIRDVVSKEGLDFEEFKALDLGCGWGRIYRLMLRYLLAERLYGVDLEQECVDICKSHMPFGHFSKVNPTPPYDFEGSTFDLVYLYSVFSHLSEDLYTSMLAEIHRMLKPKGIVAFTTLKPTHVDVWATQVNDQFFANPLSRANFDAVAWKAASNADGFLFVPTGAPGERSESFYGETVITQGYLEKTANSAGFRLVRFVTADYFPQSMVFLQKL
jgi:SAM-dependent methyltransferase